MGAGAVFVVAYAIFVLTPIGQLIDDEILEAFRAEKLTRTALTSALHWINLVTILLAAMVMVLLGAVRHRFTIGIVATVSFAAAIVLAEAFKLVLPRPAHQPELDEALGRVGVDTYPSGHSTIITAGVIALLWALGTTSRVAWLLGVAVVIVVVSATVVAGWHRPSDGIGGISLAVAVMCLAGWAMTCRLRREPAGSPDADRRHRRSGCPEPGLRAARRRSRQ